MTGWVSTVRKAVVGGLVGAGGVAAPMVAAGTIAWPAGWMAIGAGAVIGGLSVYVTPNALELTAAKALVDASPAPAAVKAAVDEAIAAFHATGRVPVAPGVVAPGMPANVIGPPPPEDVPPGPVAA